MSCPLRKMIDIAKAPNSFFRVIISHKNTFHGLQLNCGTLSAGPSYRTVTVAKPFSIHRVLYKLTLIAMMTMTEAASDSNNLVSLSITLAP